MDIAIVGAGFLGVACAWHLSQLPNVRVTLFDAEGIGAKASGLAAGLLHPFAGNKALLNWQGREAFQEALALLEVAGKEVFHRSGLMRPAANEEQRAYFYKAALRYPECQWLPHLPGLYIPSGIVVDCPLYLQSLWNACRAQLVIKKIHSPSELSHFDLRVFTLGTGFLDMPELNIPPLTKVKGQLLELSTKNPPLPHAISGLAYLTQTKPDTLVAGATYEHSWQTEDADTEVAEAYIRPKIAFYSPEIAAYPVQNCKAGFRAFTKDKRPFLVETSPNCYCLGGLGSKGLLYHAWLAKQLKLTVKQLNTHFDTIH